LSSASVRATQLDPQRIDRLLELGAQLLPDLAKRNSDPRGRTFKLLIKLLINDALYPDLLGRPIRCLVSGGAEWGDRVWVSSAVITTSPAFSPASRRAPSRALAKGLRPRDAAFRKDPVRRKSIHHRVTIITAAGCRGPFIGLPIGTDPDISINRHSAFLVKCQLAIEDTSPTIDLLQIGGQQCWSCRLMHPLAPMKLWRSGGPVSLPNTLPLLEVDRLCYADTVRSQFDPFETSG